MIAFLDYDENLDNYINIDLYLIYNINQKIKIHIFLKISNKEVLCEFFYNLSWSNTVWSNKDRYLKKVYQIQKLNKQRKIESIGNFFSVILIMFLFIFLTMIHYRYRKKKKIFWSILFKPNFFCYKINKNDNY